MKKYIFILLIFLFIPSLLWAADTKISAMTSKASPVTADTTVIVDSDGGANKKITLGTVPIAGDASGTLAASVVSKNTINPSPADGAWSGSTIVLKNGEAGSMAIGDVVCIVNDGTGTAPTAKFAKADSTASNLYPGVAMCTATVTMGNTGTFLLRGTIQNTGWAGTLAVGGGTAGIVWLSVTGTTGNTFTQTKPATAGNIQQYLGCMVNDAFSAGNTGKSKTMYFNPCPAWNIAP